MSFNGNAIQAIRTLKQELAKMEPHPGGTIVEKRGSAVTARGAAMISSDSSVGCYFD